MDMNKKNIAVIGAVFLVLLAVAGFLAWKEKARTKNVLGEEPSGLMRQDKASDLKQEFKAKLGAGKKEKLFSIAASAPIPSFCPECKEHNIDSVEGQNWEFAVSPDYTHYAYILSQGGKEHVILDGKPKKTYDSVYLLTFGPTGADFTYHAYNEQKHMTYLVYNDKEIPVYPDPEGYPQAANGISEAFSNDGRHFAYARVERDSPDFMHIILDGKVINIIKGVFIRFGFDGDTLQYVVLGATSDGSDDYRYYENDTFVKKITLREFNDAFSEFQTLDRPYDPLLDGPLLHKGSNMQIKVYDKVLFVNDAEIANYKSRNPEVYISNFTLDAGYKNLAYIVWTNGWIADKQVSLNGDDSEDIFNDIKDLHFDAEGKHLIYTARKGRVFYKVVQEIINTPEGKE